MGNWEGRSVVKFRAARGVELTKAVSRWENTVLPNEPNSSQSNGVHDVNGHFAKYGVVFWSLWSLGVLAFRSLGVEGLRIRRSEVRGRGHGACV